MGNTFRKLFNLYPGETYKAFLFSLLALLWGIGGYGTLTLSEGMLLQHVGAHVLPITYFWVAGTLFGISTLLIFFLNRIAIDKLLIYVLSIAVFGLLACTLYLSITDPTENFWILFKVFGWIMPISTSIIFWAFVDQFFDLQAGKRLFALFGAALFLGDACGAGIISFTLSYFSLQQVLFFFSALLLLSLPCIYLIRKNIPYEPDDHLEDGAEQNRLSFYVLVQKVLQSPYTITLLLFYFAMQLLAIVTEYSYMSNFERNFATDGLSSNALTEFIGFWAMIISFANMVFGIFIYSRLVRRIGVNNIILIGPIFFFGVFLLWTGKDILSIAILGMIAREGLIYTLDDNNLNLLVKAVPNRVKTQVRVALGAFFEPAGILLCAFLLFAFEEQSKILGLVISGCALVVVLFLRTFYPKAIFKNLVASHISFDKKATDWIDHLSKKERKKVEFVLLANLKKKSDEKGQLLAFEYLLKIGNKRLLPRLLHQVHSLSLPSKFKAIELLSKSFWATEQIVLEKLIWWYRIFPHPSIKSVIHFYFAQHGLGSPEKGPLDLEHDHLALRACAILKVKATPDYPSEAADEKLRLMLHSKDEKELCVGIQILGLDRCRSNINFLIEHLHHPSSAVKHQAAYALSHLDAALTREDAKKIIAYLPKNNQTRGSLLDALRNIADGESIRELILSALSFNTQERKRVEEIVVSYSDEKEPLLLAILQDRSLHDKSRLLAGKILAKTNLSLLQKRLLSIVDYDVERAYIYLYHAHMIQKQLPEQNLSMLEDALHTGYRSILDFIIQLISLAGAIEECDIMALSLKSPHQKIRAQAIESLEKIVDPRIFDSLKPLIDDRSSMEKKAEVYMRRGGIPLNLTQLLELLTRSPFMQDQIISMSLKVRLRSPDWQTTLKNKIEQEETIYSRFAEELLEGTK